MPDDCEWMLKLIQYHFIKKAENLLSIVSLGNPSRARMYYSKGTLSNYSRNLGAYTSLKTIDGDEILEQCRKHQYTAEELDSMINQSLEHIDETYLKLFPFMKGLTEKL
ncbi:MAG: hypothetical protein OWS74_01720 [Firmicutes bacterium]|nr:hypothetical protein [Bacillota bacterium]